MQTFIDTATQQAWAFEDDVTAEQGANGYTFADARGTPLAVPPTLQPYTPPAPSVAELLAAAQVAKLAELDAAYAVAVTQPVSFTSAGGVAKTFQADKVSQDTLTVSMQGYALVGSVPAGFYWVAADNAQVPFTLDDLKGLYAAMLRQGWAAFQNKQVKKAAVRNGIEVSEVEAVGWS